MHAAGYLAAIKAGAMIVMASFNSWNGPKLHGHRYLLTDILKGRLGFDGFVVGDWNAQEQVPGCTKFNCAAAILAGIDMLMAPDGWKELYQNTLARPARARFHRRASTMQCDAFCASRRSPECSIAPRRRISAIPGISAVLGSPAHRAIAREAVRKSLVLLKNSARFAAQSACSVLVAGESADDIGVQSGGWTIDWQGDQNCNADFPGATSIYAGIKAA